MLVIHNTESKKKEVFSPLHPGEVRMYVCGMTVYDYCHIGHARVLVSFDVVTRWLRECGYKVTHVRNITDIDDKIIKRANENGEDFNALTERFIAAMNTDADALGVIRPDIEPKATEYVAEIIAMVEKLILNGHAYAARNGDVYYSVSSFPGYGRLSKRNLEDLQAGARVEVDEVKNDPLDFVLWKAAKPGEPSWDSPWGPGRPGWHIECSAMSTCCLGNHFDIHGGGGDLQFPHHENEIAQSEGATGEQYVNTWMHVGFVQVNDEKMSKSLGNFFTIRDVLKHYTPEVLRYFIIASHYRSPLNYSSEALDNAKASLERFYTTLASFDFADAIVAGSANVASPGRAEVAVTEPDNAADYRQRFVAAMNDDFNTPEALAVLFELAREANRLEKAGQKGEGARHALLLKNLGGLLGLLQQDPDSFRQGDTDAGLVSEVETVIARIAAARAAKDFARSDVLRDELKARGIAVEFSREGIKWRRAD
ncbi:MAG: cysteinyl-tRNA synthetase [Moraxellaceae bacterium]|jgi:cysteinyl-tRNA synthetase|nr:cysteinyl-tRNA synthetase [Moraxellaceae bacterium]